MHRRLGNLRRWRTGVLKIFGIGTLLLCSGCSLHRGGMDMGTENNISWAFPFSEEEYTQAHSGIMPAAEVARVISELKASRGGTISDGTLLLLATVSDKTAQKVVEYRPSLAEAVRTVRKDPAAFKEAVRRAATEG